MKSFADLTIKEKCCELVRWMCVLPAATLAGMSPRFIVRLVFPPPRAQPPGAEPVQVPDFQRYYLTHIVGAIMAAAFVIVGANVAPRWRVTVAALLAVLWTMYSYVVHVAPHEGNDPRFNRYVDIAAIAAAVAIAYLWYSDKRRSDA